MKARVVWIYWLEWAHCESVDAISSTLCAPLVFQDRSVWPYIVLPDCYTYSHVLNICTHSCGGRFSILHSNLSSSYSSLISHSHFDLLLSSCIHVTHIFSAVFIMFRFETIFQTYFPLSLVSFCLCCKLMISSPNLLF